MASHKALTVRVRLAGHIPDNLGTTSSAVIAACIESETRRGRDYMGMTMAVAIAAPDVAEALAAACRAFRKAASDDLGGWHMASATAEVRPGETKPLILEHVIGKRPQATGS